MRFGFISGILCAGLFVASCTSRKFNAGSGVKETGDIASMERDPATGLYKVTCKDGTTEHAVSKVRVDSGDYCKQKASPSGTQVNPKAFNAYLLWRDGKGTPMLDYPAGFDVHENKLLQFPDGVFYVVRDTYYRRADEVDAIMRFIGSVTEGAKVEGDLLTYPSKEGRTLALRFSARAENDMKHADAVQYCKTKGLRLPHIQEVFDFCAAGTAKNSEGYYTDNRCKGNAWWSASVFSSSRNYAWQFSGYGGYVINGSSRDFSYGVRCVGGE